MAYGAKYSGTVQGLDGVVYTFEILERDYAGGVTTVRSAKNAIKLKFGSSGRTDPYVPVLASVVDLQVFEKTTSIQDDIFGADENKYQLRLKKGADTYWLGKILTDIYQGTLDIKPKATRVSAVDGLGLLQDRDFTLTGRESLIKTIADVLGLIGFGLNIHVAHNWFTKEMASGDDPAAKIRLDRELFRNDDGTFQDCFSVLKKLLTRFNLQLYQSSDVNGHVWKIVQFDLLAAATYKLFVYDKDANPLSTIAAHDPAVTITSATEHSKRLSGGVKSALKALKKTKVHFIPKGDYKRPIYNGDFELWTGNDPWGWGKTGTITVTPEETDPLEALKSLKIQGQSFTGGTPGLATDYIELLDTAANVGIGVGHKIRLAFSVAMRAGGLYGAYYSRAWARWAAIEVQVGDYFLTQPGVYGVFAWVHKDLVGAVGVDAQRYLLLPTGGGSVSPLYINGPTQEISWTSPLNAQLDAGGIIRVRIYRWQYSAPEYISLDSPASAIFDDLKVDFLPIGNEGVGVETTAEDSITANETQREIEEFDLGDGFSTASRSSLTVTDDYKVSKNWKRGAYGGGDPLTGKSVDEILAESFLRTQKVSAVDMHSATYRRATAGGVSIEIGNILVIGSKRYAPLSFERDLKRGHAKGEWVEVRADDTNISLSETTLLDEDATSSGGGGASGGGSGSSVEHATSADFIDRPIVVANRLENLSTYHGLEIDNDSGDNPVLLYHTPADRWKIGKRTTTDTGDQSGTFSDLRPVLTDQSIDTLTGKMWGESFKFALNNTYDIGLSGSNQPRDLFLGRNALIGGTLGVTGLITAMSNGHQFGNLTIGVNDSQPGLLTLRGSGAADTQGGRIILHTAADHDTTYDYFDIEVTSANLKIQSSTDAGLSLSGDGILTVSNDALIGGGTRAGAGTIRLANDRTIKWRNSTNSGDFSLKLSSANEFEFDGPIFGPSMQLMGALTLGTALSIGNGGTGQTTQASGFDALAPTTTRGDLVYRGASSNARLPIGGEGVFLKSNGTDPVWSTISVGDVFNAVPDSRTLTMVGTANQVIVSTGAQDLSANRSWTFSLPQNIHSGASPTFVDLTLTGGDVVLTAAQTNIRTDTSDGTDNKRVILTGGGAGSTTRGAYVILHGNEYATETGSAWLFSGNTATSVVDIRIAGDTARRLLIENNGNVTMTGALSVGSNLTATGLISAAGATAGLRFDERSTPGTFSQWYRNANIMRLYDGALDVFTVAATSGNVSITGDLTVTGGDVVLGSTTSTILTNSSDGSDNKRVILGGGGSAAVSRGGYIVAQGNEYATEGGWVIFAAGSASGSRVASNGHFIPYTNDTNLLGESGKGWRRMVLEHTANQADGIWLRQTAAATASPRLFFENPTSWAGSGIAVFMSSANALSFTTGATAGSSSGTLALMLTQTQLRLSAAAGTNREYVWTTANTNRWGARASSTAESGLNAGSNWALARYDDAGGWIDDVLSFVRSTGAASLSGTVSIGGHLNPSFTDTSDIGTSVLWWKQQFVSQINGAVFAENVIQLLGGWFVVGKSQGTFQSAVASGSTTIDFGAAMTTGHFVVVKSHDTGGAIKTEYIQVGTLVSGTNYNVTRDVAGAHVTDPAWAEGTPFLVLGTTGDGRIEFNAFDTPRVQILEQGATYNAQTERVRVGDLNGWQSAGLTGYGWAAGDVAGNEYAYYAPSSGLIVRGTVRADDGFLNNLDVSGALNVGAGGVIKSGATAYDVGVGWWLDYNGGTPRLFLGNSAGNKLTWDGTTLSISGSITSTTGSIGGWIIGASTLTGGNASLSNTGVLTLGTVNDVAILSAADATYRLWIGHATAASALLRVTKAGVLTASGASVSGTLYSPDSTSAQRVELSSSELKFYESSVLRVNIKSSVGPASLPGMEVNGGAVDVLNGLLTSRNTTGGLAARFHSEAGGVSANLSGTLAYVDLDANNVAYQRIGLEAYVYNVEGSALSNVTSVGLKAFARHGGTNWAIWAEDGHVRIDNNLGVGTPPSTSIRSYIKAAAEGEEIQRLETAITGNVNPVRRTFQEFAASSSTSTFTLWSKDLSTYGSDIGVTVVVHVSWGAAVAGNPRSGFTMLVGHFNRTFESNSANQVGATATLVDIDPSSYSAIALDTDGANTIRVRITPGTSSDMEWNCTVDMYETWLFEDVA